MVSAIEQSFGPHQLWYVSYPGGEARQITNDLNDYTSVSVTADSSSLVTVQREVNFSMWVAPMNGNALSAPPPNTFPIERDPFRQITSVGRKRDGYSGIAWTPDGRITYTSAAAGTYDIWVMQPDGSGQRQLTTAAPGVISHTNGFQSISPDGRYIFFSSDRVTGSPHIWRMDASGGNLKQLTNGAGENFAQVTPDGQSVIYIDFANIAIAKVSIDGGQPTQLSDRAGGRPTISPDGKLIAFGLKVDQNAPAKIALMPSSGGAPIKLLDVPVTADLLSLTWTPDSRALAYVDTRGGISNLWSVPIDGGASAQLTDFRADRMSCFDFSRDGKWVAISRGNSSNDVVLFSNVK
jgi:Tol biopolymer transport system component